jgi:type I restriction enzyme S subunit
MSELPLGWVSIPLDVVSNLIRGVTYKKDQSADHSKEGYLPVLRANNIQNGKLQFDDLVFVLEQNIKDIQKIRKGDIVVAMSSGSKRLVGKSGIAETDFNGGFGAFCGVLRPSQYLNSKYVGLYTLTKEYSDLVSSLSKGVNINNLKPDHFSEINIPIAPLNEQIRIADKLDSVLAKVDAAQTRLEKIPTLLKRFRQSVLAAATSGELTREWRETNGMRLDQWSWKKLSDIAEIQGGVTKDSKKQSDEDEEIPYLRVANVQRGYLDLTEIKTIRIPSLKLEKLLLKQGDVLFNEGGDLDKLGRGWVWENQISRCSFQNHVFRARLYDSNNSSKYISWWGNTQGHEYFIRQGKQTTNLASINKTILSNLPIKMPPAEEQKEIVRRVESLFALADTVEKQYLAAKQRLDRLTQSLLAKAFRGELVPQDPNDEPAAELLKRTQAERQQQAAEKPKRKAGARGGQNTITPKQTKTNTMQLKDAPENYLLELLAQLGGETHAEVLWKKSELAIDDFYAKLKQEMQANGIVEDKNSPDPALRKLKVANG